MRALMKLTFYHEALYMVKQIFVRQSDSALYENFQIAKL